jgi:hypothetical protein
MRSASYKPCGNRDCPHEGVAGPCWGQVELVDEQHTESQWVPYYACKGHARYALYGHAEDYLPEGGGESR